MVKLNGKLLSITLLVVMILAACKSVSEQGPGTEPRLLPSSSPTTVIPTTTSIPTTETNVKTEIPEETSLPVTFKSPIGIGLRKETVDVVLSNQECSGLTMTASSELAETYFPQLKGWTRIIGAPSLEELNSKGERANTNNLTYEGMAYGLETGQSTPDVEWQNLIGSTDLARSIADVYGRLLVMGPGFQLMSQNEDKYGPMASMADVWVLQTQQLQKNPPGPAYREEVDRIVGLIRSDNPGINIWAQITLPPDREPDAEEWLEYRKLIADTVDGTYIGVYTWDRVDNEVLISTIETIFGTVCGDDQNQ